MTRTLHSVHDVYDGLFNTATGVIIDINNPVPSMFHLEDIAAALSKICRFGGQIGELYTVAQHSILVCELAPDNLKLEALMHDATEAYLGDVIKPLKVILGKAYTDIEDAFTKVLCVRFGLNPDKLLAVKEYDKVALTIEHEWFQQNNPDPWYATGMFPPREALPFVYERAFTEYFHFYTKNRIHK